LNDEIYQQATFPGVQNCPADVLLARLADDLRRQLLEALTAVLLRPAALELADALEEPLKKAKEAVEPARQAAQAAGMAFQDADAAYAAARAAYQRRERPDEPNRDEVRRLEQEFTEAQRAVERAERTVAYHELQIAGLRAAPEPDPAILERLGLGTYEP
jgi:hypothetical protein